MVSVDGRSRDGVHDEGRVAYATTMADSSRWDGFELRADDIVISTPPKCGTTWTQMICALLVFATPTLPEPLTALSPWLDMQLLPVEEVRAQLDAQQHRRFIKTHTPLDGLPTLEGVTYIVVGRDPRDVAVSLHHHRENMDSEALAAQVEDTFGTPAEEVLAERGDTEDLHTDVMTWITDDSPPQTELHSLRATVHHLDQAWQRRDDPDVVLLHYRDMRRDLAGQMRFLAGRLGITIEETVWPELVKAATLREMRSHADDLVPDEQADIMVDNEQFFRRGANGEGAQLLTDDDLAVYQLRLDALTSTEVVGWLHGGSGPS